MLAKVPRSLLEDLTVRDLEHLLELKKKETGLAELLRERDRLRLELRRVEDSIEAMERANLEERGNNGGHGVVDQPRSFLAGKRKKSLKDYIAQVLLEAGEPLSPSDIQKRLPEAGYQSSSTNPRSFYNTVFQALQRYDAFQKDGRKYLLANQVYARAAQTAEILPKKKTRLKDFIIEVLSSSPAPLKVSEIASRVVIAGYSTDLAMDELNQRVSATLKKYLNRDFDWDSQRYRLATRA
jgi:hypothetical protein